MSLPPTECRERYCHCERSVAISPVIFVTAPYGVPRALLSLRACEAISRVIFVTAPYGVPRSLLSLRGTKQSRLSLADKQIKERLPRFARNDRMCHREERGDLAFPKSAKRQKRDCRASLATPQGGFDKNQSRFARNDRINHASLVLVCHCEVRSNLAFP